MAALWTRYMPLQRSASSATDRPKLPSVSAVPSTSNSSRPPSATTKMPSTRCSAATAVPLMSVSCYATRTPCSSASSSKRVCLSISFHRLRLVLVSPLSVLTALGINVHAELRMKNSDRPRGGPVNHPSSLARAAMSRHAIAHRRIGIPSKSDPAPIYHQDSYGLPSPQPQTQPQPPQPQLQTPPSAVSSPSAMRSPYFMQRLSPAASDIPPPPAAATQPPVSLLSQPAPYHAPRSVGSAPTNDRLEPGQSQLLHPLIPSPVSTSNVQLVNNNGEYYKASPLQKHYDQLGTLLHTSAF